MIRSVVLLGILAGCVESNAVECGDRVCPQDTVCIELTQDAEHVVASDPHRCVDEGAVAACDAIVELDACAAGGACYRTTSGLVCLPASCGNGLRDKLEVCDDGNADVGDGCSAACLSNETCGNGIVDGLRIDDEGVYRPGEACDDANLLGHDGCASVCEAERPVWSDDTPSLPSARMRAPMVYDPVRRRIVLVGGHRQSGTDAALGARTPLADVWESDGIQWVQQHPDDAPSARIGAAVAYDAPRHLVVLFGGRDDHARSDTWAWNGARWRLLVPAASPPARSGHGLAYDGRRKVVVLFGGTDEQSNGLNDTWEWNGTTWAQVSPTTSPSARDAAMAYDPTRGVIVMVGKPASGGAYETWEYDGTTWSKGKDFAMAAPTEPPATTSLAFDAASATILAHSDAPTGGGNTFAWNGTNWTKLDAALPGDYIEASLAETPDGHVMLFGGQYTDCGGILCMLANRNQTFLWDGTSWQEQVLDGPEERIDAAAALDTRRRVLVVVGGWNSSSGTVYQQTLEYNGFSWKKLVGQPWSSGRYGAALAYDEGRDQMVLFGGTDQGQTLDAETWIRSGQTWMQATPGLSPSPRVESTMAYDPVRREVVLFGGGTAANYDGGDSLSDTWVWDGTTWTNRTPLPPAASPPGRRGAVLAWDSSLQQLVLFGGGHKFDVAASNVDIGDTWTWDGTSWTEHPTPLAPSARHLAAFAPDQARHTLVLVGGMDATTTLADSWEWDGTGWHALAAVDAPAARLGHVLAPHPSGAGVVAFGGSASNFAPFNMGATSHLTWTDAVDYEMCDLAIDFDGDSLAGCADPDCWTRCAPTCAPRNVCDPQAPRCGDGTCSSVEDCRICPADCTTCPDRCGDSVCDPAETPASCPGDCTP